MIAEIQCVAQPTGTADDRYAHIDAAIAVLRASGLHHEVGALGTTVEGEPEVLWPLLRRVHEACLAAGADSVVSVLKLAQTAPGRPPVAMDALTAAHRP